MFFIFSKILINLIYPFTWIITLLILSLFNRNAGLRRHYLIASISLLLIFSNPFLLNLFAKYWDINPTTPIGSYSCAIILGGFVSEDKDGNGYFNTASDRFIQAIKLKNSGKADNLLFSGGNGNLLPGGFREADWLLTELKNYKIADSSIIIEKNSRNTLENAKFSKNLLNSKKLAPPYLLVTSAFHMRRSMFTFEKTGIDVLPYSANYIAGREKATFDTFIPSAEALLKWNIYIKEIIGFVAYYFKT